MNCQKNVVVAVLVGVLAGSVLGAGTSQIAQVMARRQAISTEDADRFAAPREDSVYRNNRSIHEYQEGNWESETLPRQRWSVLQPFQELQRRVHKAAPSSFIDAKVPRECRGLIGRSLDRCVKRINGSGVE